MKIRDIHQSRILSEFNWSDAAKSFYAGATGQQNLMPQANKFNVTGDKAKEGAKWFTDNFVRQAKNLQQKTPADFEKLAQSLTKSITTNQTGLFAQIKKKLGLGPTSADTVDSLVANVKKSMGQSLTQNPELSKALDKLQNSYNDLITKSGQYKPGQQIDPTLQQAIQGFAVSWYNLPSAMDSAASRAIQSATYGDRWIDAGNGFEIKPASVYDRNIQARYQDEIFFYDKPSQKWTDNTDQPLDPKWQISLNQAMKNAGIKVQHTGAPPDQQKTDADQTTGSGLVIPASQRKRSPQQQAALQTPAAAAAQQPVMIKGRSGREFQYNDKDKTWSTAGEIISDPRIIQRLNKLALPQFQNRAMGLKTRGAQNNVFS